MTDYISAYTGEEIDAGIAKANIALQSYEYLNSVIEQAFDEITDEDTEITLNNTIQAKMKMELKGNTEQTTYTGKNLLPNSESLSNTGQYQDVIRFTDLEPSTEYTLKVKGTAGDKFYTGGSMPYSSLTIPSNGVLEFTFTTNSTISDAAIIKNTTATNTLPLTECTLCKGSTATYEPYVGGTPSPNPDYPQDVRVVSGNNTIIVSNSDNTQSQTYPINLGTMELCKIGSYQDYIYKDNGKWYKHSEIGKVVLDGSEDWLLDTTKTITQVFKLVNTLPNKLSYNLTIFNNYFTLANPGDTEKIALDSIDAIDVFIAINKTTASTVAEFKTWLSTHNTIVYYVLAASTNTEITDTTLIGQLNNLENAMSYKTQTNISQTNANLSFILYASALGKLSS